MVVVGALIIGGAFLFTGGDGGKDDEAKETPSPTETSPSPTPSETEEPTEDPDDLEDPWGPDPDDEETSARPSDFDFESLAPTPTSGPWPAYQLKPGDCFDLSEEKQGHNDKLACSTSHDGEVVYQEKLTKDDYKTDDAVGKAAEALCKSKLEAKARQQSSGTKFRTLSQYPKLSGLRLGMKTVTCSLVAQEGEKLSAKLK